MIRVSARFGPTMRHARQYAGERGLREASPRHVRITRLGKFFRLDDVCGSHLSVCSCVNGWYNVMYKTGSQFTRARSADSKSVGGLSSRLHVARRLHSVCLQRASQTGRLAYHRLECDEKPIARSFARNTHAQMCAPGGTDGDGIDCPYEGASAASAFTLRRRQQRQRLLSFSPLDSL